MLWRIYNWIQIFKIIVLFSSLFTYLETRRIYFISTIHVGVSLDYLARIIGLLSMLSLIMSNHGMSNNSEYWHFAASVVHDRSQINLLRNMHEPSHPAKYSHGFISYQTPYNANARRVQFDEIEFIVMYIIILSAHIDKLNESKRSNKSPGIYLNNTSIFRLLVQKRWHDTKRILIFINSYIFKI